MPRAGHASPARDAERSEQRELAQKASEWMMGIVYRGICADQTAVAKGWVGGGIMGRDHCWLGNVLELDHGDDCTTL